MASSSHQRVQYSQNFLHNRKLVSALVAQSGITDRDVVLEIGPGKGIITEALADTSLHVLAIEKDPHRAAGLRNRLGEQPNITTFSGDVLAFPLPETAYKVFANIPFRSTSAIIGKLTGAPNPPDDIQLVVQKEAADRYTGVPIATMVSASLAPWSAAEVTHRFRRKDFSPRPAVDCVLLRLEKRQDVEIDWHERERFCRMVEAVCSAWKPTVAMALRALVSRSAYAFAEATLAQSLHAKPSALDTQEWIRIYECLHELGDMSVWDAFARASAALRQQQHKLDKPTRTRARSSRRCAS